MKNKLPTSNSGSFERDTAYIPCFALADDVIIAEAHKWEMRHGGISGRTAQQFINSLLGKSI